MAKFKIVDIEKDETLYDVFNGMSISLQKLADGGCVV